MKTHPNPTPTSRLTTEQIARFQREGYLVYRQPVLPRDEFEALKQHFETALAALPPDNRPEGMDVPHFTDPALFRWLLADTILDLVEPLIGPDIALFSSHFICKPKGDGRRVPWHEDAAFWKRMVTPGELVTVWLAIDPSTRENGCMCVIPRTHATGRRGYSDYGDVDTKRNVFALEIKAEQRNSTRAVPCELAPNQCSLHDARLIHGSAPNTSTQRRCGYTMRFMGTHVKLSAEAQRYHQIYLARGRDKAGNPYAEPGQVLPGVLDCRAELDKKVH